VRLDSKNCDESPPNPDRIEISSSSSSGIHGGPVFRSTWVLERFDKGIGYVTNTTNAGSLTAETKKYEVPAEVFDRCLGMVLGIDFFYMREQSKPKVLFENSASNIRVKWNGLEHSVQVIYPATPPVGFEKLQKFVNELPERGREVP
jgi:hypothetical protein